MKFAMVLWRIFPSHELLWQMRILLIGILSVVLLVVSNTGDDVISQMKPHTIQGQQTTFIVPQTFTHKAKNDKTNFSSTVGLYKAIGLGS